MDTNGNVVINPLWITWGVMVIRTILQLGGFGAWLTAHPDSPTQIVSAVVTVGSIGWSFYAWYQSRQHKLAIVANPEKVVVK